VETEERTALSILMALRKRFAREEKNPRNYDSKEIYIVLKEAMKNMSSKKFVDFLRESELDGTLTIFGDEVIDKAINKSKIRRFPWNQVLGMTLTKAIHICRNNGMNVNETFFELRKNENLLKFIKDNPILRNKIIENLEISVHARFGESNSAEDLKNTQKRENQGEPEKS